jgi:hypothetical protein
MSEGNEQIECYSLQLSEVKGKTTKNDNGELAVYTCAYPNFPPEFGYFRYSSILFSYPHDRGSNCKYIMSNDCDVMLFVVRGSGTLEFKHAEPVCLAAHKIIKIHRKTAYRFVVKPLDNVVLFVGSTAEFEFGNQEIVQ